MQFKNLLALIFLTAFYCTHSQQKLYEPIEIKQAFAAGTRLYDGRVSDTYRQNKADYTIRAAVDPATRQVNAEGTIVYHNRHQEALTYLVFHAYKNVYPFPMIIQSLAIDGVAIDVNDENRIRNSGTTYALSLNEPLQTGDSVSLSVKWSITIPPRVNRDGAYDATSMMVAYWYPEIAVYDDVFGWDRINFDGAAEFYHDVNSYNITLTLPDGFVVWASAPLANPKDVFTKKILKRIAASERTDEKVTIIGPDDIEKGIELKGTTWKFEADSLPDFAFAFSDHYIWESCTYSDQYGSYRLHAAYPEANTSFALELGLEKEALAIFHNEFPKYPFPYHQFIAFNGETGGGMEFPGMCNNQAKNTISAEGNEFDPYEANKLLTVHEMTHMYFPFLVGVNEKRFAWMDEGMSEFAEDYFSGINLYSDHDRSRFARSTNPPLMVETYTIPKTYGINTYDIASQSYHALINMLGASTFNQCMQAYISRWAYKHPTPYDFFYTFNDVSGKDLNWFWKAWYFDWGYPDMGIKQFDEQQLIIENIGGRPLALEVAITDAEGGEAVIKVNPEVWQHATEYSLAITVENVTRIELKTLNGADAINTNNVWEP